MGWKGRRRAGGRDGGGRRKKIWSKRRGWEEVA